MKILTRVITVLAVLNIAAVQGQLGPSVGSFIGQKVNITSPEDYYFLTVQYRGLPGAWSSTAVRVDDSGVVTSTLGPTGFSSYDSRPHTSDEASRFEYLVLRKKNSSENLYNFNIESTPLVPLVSALAQTFYPWGTDIEDSEVPLRYIVEDSSANKVDLRITGTSLSFDAVIELIVTNSGCRISREEDALVIDQCN